MVTKQSVYGILSFSLAILVIASGVFFLGWMGASSTDLGSDLREANYLGMVVLVCIMLNLVALVLGIIGLTRHQNKKSLAVWGIIISGCSALSIYLLIS
ncbi:hypothetical protein [Zooshikella harenae]|uniref:DUF4064 domain-containing protein n=1 Tax=Zooshikella harenae TaxID=2827238 RepID=A0ABS5Z988_9GAMM|nr:hypothetical protein [Zooshikella harenae]MBU2710458.1 hypothetical protein [Zooshikella harenae]